MQIATTLVGPKHGRKRGKILFWWEREREDFAPFDCPILWKYWARSLSIQYCGPYLETCGKKNWNTAVPAIFHRWMANKSTHLEKAKRWTYKWRKKKLSWKTKERLEEEGQTLKLTKNDGHSFSFCTKSLFVQFLWLGKVQINSPYYLVFTQAWQECYTFRSGYCTIRSYIETQYDAYFPIQGATWIESFISHLFKAKSSFLMLTIWFMYRMNEVEVKPSNLTHSYFS